MERIVQIAVEELHDSPFNPREVYHEADDLEMIADIKAHGRILQPLQVRPRLQPLFGNDPDAATGYEVVFGHRRKRNGIAAGLTTLPCMVSAIDDATARRMQISENLSRKDVHPMEEAKGFQSLIDNDNETADTIAEKFGKSRSYVYGRLKLLNASAEVRKLCVAGQIDAEVALLIARLGDAKQQQHAIEFIRKDYRYSQDLGNGGKQSYRHLRDLLNEKFTLALKHAIFPIEDEMLVPLAGNCVRCVKRTGNAPEFEDIVNAEKVPDHSRQHHGADVCTDPVCFDEKKKAYLKREAAALEAKGQTVVQGGKARQVIDAGGQLKNGYVKASDVKAELASVKGSVQVVTIQNPRDGKTVKAVKVDDMKAAGVKVKEPKKTGRYDHEAERQKREAEHQRNEVKAKAESAYRRALLDKVRAAAAAAPRSEFDLRLVAHRVFGSVGWRDKETLAEIHGVKNESQLEKLIGSLDMGKLALFMLDCTIIERQRVDAYSLGTKPEVLLAAAEHYGIDAAAVRAELLKPAKSAPIPSKAARAPKGAKAAAAVAKGKKGKAADAAKKQKDDAGDAGEVVGQVDLLEGAEA